MVSWLVRTAPLYLSIMQYSPATAWIPDGLRKGKSRPSPLLVTPDTLEFRLLVKQKMTGVDSLSLSFYRLCTWRLSLIDGLQGRLSLVADIDSSGRR